MIITPHADSPQNNPKKNLTHFPRTFPVQSSADYRKVTKKTPYYIIISIASLK